MFYDHQIQYFEGYKDTYLLQSNEDMSWTFRERDKTQQTYTNKLITRNSFDNSPIGRQNWLVTEPRCGYQASTKILTLSMCIFGKQFTCHSGDCIDIERRCDEIMDCDNECSNMKNAIQKRIFMRHPLANLNEMKAGTLARQMFENLSC